MESRESRKRGISWSFSPTTAHKSHHRSRTPSPNAQRIIAEKENALSRLANTITRDVKTEGILTHWRSPKCLKSGHTFKKDFGIRSSLGDSPTRRKSPIIVEPPSLIADIEDLTVRVGSSFFSESDIAVPSDAPIGDAEGKFVRLKIVEVRRERTPDQGGLKKGLPQIVLQCETCSLSERMVTVILRGLWIECDYQPGTRISITPPFKEEEIIIDGRDGVLLCYDPEKLISITTVADAVSCLRKAALSIKMQPSPIDNRPTIHLVSGSVSHDVFEQAILDPSRLDSMTELVNEFIKRHLSTIYACGEDEVSVRSTVCKILSGFRPWCDRFLRETPNVDASVLDSGSLSMSKNICIPKVYSLEESITSLGLGLKGKLDAVVLMRFDHNAEQMSLMVPLELKTGKSTSSTAHRAQTLLYTLLLADRYNIPIRFGLLYYVASNTLLRMVASTEEIQALVMTRNRLVAACNNQRYLPRPISNSHSCKQCSQLENCSIMLKINQEPHNDDMNETIAGCVSTIPKVADFEFFYKWKQLVDFEESEALVAKNISREQHHRLVGILTALNVSDAEGYFGKFQAEFAIDLTKGLFEITEGDPVAIFPLKSLEHEAAIGFIIKMKKDQCVIGCDRNIKMPMQPAVDFEFAKNQHFESIDVIGNSFAIVRDELLSGFALMRSNLVRLHSPRSSIIYQLIVDARPPKFQSLPSFHIDGLDQDQNAAISHCLAAKEYALLLGMPGAGKTTTLVSLVQKLVSQKAKILISSYTHSAVDNLLTKLLERDVPILRFGNLDKIDKRLTHCTFNSTNFGTIAEMRRAIQRTSVFGTTCLGANNPILGLIEFDYCIVDEASQITVPVVLGPLMLAKKFILVGDHYQLPPLVRSEKAIALGLNKSLFEILAERQPSSVAFLRNQYRMCEDIQLVANRTVYNNQLQCGSELVRCASLEIPLSVRESLFCSMCGDSSTCWIKELLSPARKVCFVDTDMFYAREEPVGNSFANINEAHLINILVSTLIVCNVKAERICAISAFRPQIKTLSDLVPEGVEISTVDRYQGRDKDCVIFSFVRSNPDHNIGMLLCDWHRLNVAFTRARCKLIMVGSWSTIMAHSSLAILRDVIIENGWYLKLPSKADRHEML